MYADGPSEPHGCVTGSRERPPAPSADATVYCDAWQAAFQIPSIIVTLDMVLIWSNEAARDFLATAEPLHYVNGRLIWADKVQNAAFRAFVNGLEAGPRVWVHRADEGPDLLARGEAVRPDGAAPGAAVMLYPVDPASRYIWADLEGVFGLTRAEAVIVKRIIGGERADVMAEDLGVTLETVRTHIRRIYNKLSINSREQLFSLISPFRVS